MKLSKLDIRKFPQNKLSKPQLGHLEKSDLPPLKYLKEYTVDSIESYSLNQKITVDLI